MVGSNSEDQLPQTICSTVRQHALYGQSVPANLLVAKLFEPTIARFLSHSRWRQQDDLPALACGLDVSLTRCNVLESRGNSQGQRT